MIDQLILKHDARETNFASYPNAAAFSSVGAPPFSEDIANDLVKKALATKERLFRATKSIGGALPTTRRNRHDSMQRERKFGHTQWILVRRSRPGLVPDLWQQSYRFFHAPEHTLPACRRLLFPLFRRLHAGKRIHTKFQTSPPQHLNSYPTSLN